MQRYAPARVPTGQLNKFKNIFSLIFQFIIYSSGSCIFYRSPFFLIIFKKFAKIADRLCPDGGIGIRCRLKICRPKGLVGSSPTPGTSIKIINMKIVICGSMTAAKEMMDAEKKLRELGHEIILPEFTGEYASMDTIDKVRTESSKNKVEYDLIRGYFEKIKNSDAILVANVERKGVAGYIGGNSFLEMGFAFALNKPIYLLHEIPDMGYRDEIEAMAPIIINGDFSKIWIHR